MGNLSGERGSPPPPPLLLPSLGLNLPTPCWLRALSSPEKGGVYGSAGVLVGFPVWYKLSPSLSRPFQIPLSPRCGSPVWAQTLSPLPPSSRGLAEAARDPLAAARFLPKKARMQLHAPREHLDPIPGMNGSRPRLPTPLIPGLGRERAEGAGPQSGEMGRSAALPPPHPASDAPGLPALRPAVCARGPTVGDGRLWALPARSG